MEFTEIETYIINRLQTSCNLHHIPVYRDGILIAITDIPDDSLYEERQYAYNAAIFISDEKVYNLNDIESIKELAIPQFDSDNISAGVTNNLAYIIKMRACIENEPEKSLYLCYKAASLMIDSKINWSKKDYTALVEHLLSVGEIKQANKLEQMMKEKLSIFDDCHMFTENFNRALESAKELGTDLLVTSSHQGTCKECSMFQNRVYSISGKSKKYPPLPKQVFEYGGFHKGCRHTFHPFIDGISIFQIQKNGTFVTVNPKKYSNRPYVDERTEQDIQQYEEYINKMKMEQRTKELTRKYYHLKATDPSLVPKSLYTYLKNANK